jgi:pyruvate formate lyase activating enzyme
MNTPIEDCYATAVNSSYKNINKASLIENPAMKKEAMFWKPLKNQTVQCLLCPHHCTIAPEKHGICGVRKNEAGTLYSLIYQVCSSIAVDPIEKKPLYHFHPGSHVLSLGSVGCTFRCEHCQNYQISMATPDGHSLREIPADQLGRIAKEKDCSGIAWTYNEPTIWHEYTLEAAQRVKEAGLYTVYVTNGYIEEDPLKQIAPYLDAMNIDVKAFQEQFYKKICKAKLAPVLRACEQAKDLGIHLELTYLVIPDLNDTLTDIDAFCQWIAEKLGTQTPLHFSRFHPDYHMTDIPATPLSTLLACHAAAKDAGLQFVYLGNISHGDYDNTYCPSCKNLLVERYGFSAHIKGLVQGTCSQCGMPIPMRLG